MAGCKPQCAHVYCIEFVRSLNSSRKPARLFIVTSLTFLLQVMKAETRAIWEQLFTDITQFDDFRQFKTEQGGNGSDFRHKLTGQGLR